MKKLIFIVDDDALVRTSVSLLLKHAAYDVEQFSSPNEVLERVRVKIPDLLIMDMNFSLSTSGEEGLELLQKTKIFCPQTPIILITAWGSIALAVKGMQAGAFDFITKPWDNWQLLQAVSTALELTPSANALSEELQTRKELDHRFDFSKIVGHSDALLKVLKTVARVANTNASVLITGESGTGKELIAEAIHLNSIRCKEAFVKVNLGGLSSSLFESEMFGHKKGAFTDAVADRIGRFEMANKGTIFLDEIGDLDAMCQVKLLRVLQDHSFERLGDSKVQKVDVRVLSATNANLDDMVKDKTFREDLFYRINLIHIDLPPLRERKEDIPLLVQHFSEQVIRKNGLPPKHFSSGAMTKIQSLPLLGNIRELKNIVERSLIMCASDKLEADDVQTDLTGEGLHEVPVSPMGMSLEELEADRIRQSLLRHQGNISKSAKELGISRAALYRRMSKYNIEEK